MKHLYASNDCLDLERDTTDIELVAMTVIAVIMAKEDKHFAQNLRYYLSNQIREGTTTHRSLHPETVLETQEEFDNALFDMCDRVLHALKSHLSSY